MLTVACALLLSPAFLEQPVILPMHATSERLPVIDVKVNGRSFQFGLDTCASGFAHLRPGVIEGFGLKPTGKARASDGTGKNPVEIDLFTLESLEIGGITLKNVQANGRPHVGGGADGRHKIDGIVGFPTFKEVTLTLDYPNRRVLIDKTPLDPKDPNTFSFTSPRGIPVIELEVNGKKINCHLDSGSMGGLLVPGALAKELPLGAEPKVVAKAKSIANTFDILEAPLKGNVKLGPHTLVDPTLQFAEIFNHANIGYLVLKNYSVSFDQRQKLVRLVPASK